MIKKLTILLFLFFTTINLAKANFDFNANCINAYEAIFDLRLTEAKTLIQREKSQNPNNGISILLDNYVDFFTLLTSESKADYERLKSLKTSRLNLLEKQDKNSPYYLFAQAEVNLQWGLLKSRYQDFLSSALDIRRADNLLDENGKKFPGFLPNKKSAGLIDVIMGAIPSNLKSLSSTFGFTGNVNRGINTLESLMSSLPKTSYNFYSDEVVFFLCYIETDLAPNKNNYQKTMSYLASNSNKSLLKAYLQGYISMRNGRNDTAISYLTKRPQGSNYSEFPLINYLIGNAKLNRMDSDANIYLIKYLKEYNGINYVKDAYLKLSYYYYLRNDDSRYHAFLKMVKSQGNTIDEKDKQALKEANDTPPNKDLLKARFYFDGGYYAKALAQLQGNSVSDFKLQRDQIEYYYRFGRVYDELGKSNDAIANYQKAMSLGKTTSYYYAANAALFIGYIYENKNDRPRAASYFKQSIAMKNHEYENSIETKAKDGLKRIGY
ncbi:MAG: tetratricopeptide repeat protein [Pelobium sp.]